MAIAGYKILRLLEALWQVGRVTDPAYHLWAYVTDLSAGISCAIWFFERYERTLFTVSGRSGCYDQ
jgi:hypothetical protein